MKTHGGKRQNCGRKPVADKKVQVSFYIEQSKIDKLGGLEVLKEKVYKYIYKSH